MATLGYRRKNDPAKLFIHDQGQDVLGAWACIRCHGYIERNPILVISAFESVVRCVNCGRLYRWLNTRFERYPSDKREWNAVEITNRKRNGNRDSHGKGEGNGGRE